MEKDLISIIVPIYNVEKYLERCIDSIINQTYINLQIILVDDGSTDKSGEICEKYKKLDNRIIVVHKENGGLADARNTGMVLVKGSYVGFVDSDDYIALDMYEKLLFAIKSYNTPIACCGRVDFFEKRMNKRPEKRFVKRGITCYNNEEAMKALCLYDGMDFSVCDKLIRTNLFQGLYFPIGRVSEDIPVVYTLYKRTNGVVHIGKAKYYYCHRNNSISGSKFYINKLDYLFFIQKIYRDLLVKYPEMKKEAEVLYYNAIIIMWNEVRTIQPVEEQYQAVEKKLRRLIKHYLLKYVCNPFTSKEQCIYIIRELWNERG